MFVILTYDVRQKRVAKLRKTVMQYLIPVQRSVFHGYVTQKSYHRLKADIASVIDTDEDAVAVYLFSDTTTLATEELGRASMHDTAVL